ncbi:MAG: KpsF/GutQ family sugar-phosphate isomerase [Bdellovibrionales bacterium]|nr:KpsF/GutQ family sugar-phosphate isomerase [Bdellovibrionales bacterium]
MDHKTLLGKARELLRVEAAAVNRCADRLDASFVSALECIQRAHTAGRKIVLTGIGKSHYVAAKLSASFMSTGVTAIFLHPVEALHGDLGVVQPGDVVIMFSKSGTTPELLNLLPMLKGRTPIIAITGNLESQIARQSDIVLDSSIEKEACPINMLPTASTTVALALGDALVSVYAEQHGFSREIFAGFHPGGSIGKRLTMHVRDLAIPLEKIAYGSSELDLRAVARAMTEKPMGAFCAVDSEGRMSGFITEGDLRRAVAKGTDFTLKASSIMTPKPTILTPDLIVEDAIAILQQANRRLACAPLVDAQGMLRGLVRLDHLI